MSKRSLAHNEIAVIITPERSATSELISTDKSSGGADNNTRSADNHNSSYDAFIYTDLKADTLIPVDNEEVGQPGFIGKLPLASMERVLVRWDLYQDYIKTFFRGETAARAFLRNLGRKKARTDLFELEGPFLKTLFEGGSVDDRPTHLWWHSERPELVGLPWELMVYSYSSESATAAAGAGSSKVSVNQYKFPLSFIRGLPPPTTAPKVPVSGPLKLAFIHEPSVTSTALLDALKEPPPNIEVTYMTGLPREALLTAVNEGYELVHLVTDGTVSLANDGTLYLRKALTPRESRSPFISRLLRGILPLFKSGWLGAALEAELAIDKCSPSELSALLRGSRISVLSLSAPKSTNTEPDRLDSYLLPKVYRAFCSLGSSSLPLPTIIAPVGATDDPEMSRFWRGFYADLGQHLDIPKAMASGLTGQPPIAIAQFLRHHDGKLFKRVSPEEHMSAVDPIQLDDVLQLSQELVAQLTAQFGESESMPDSYKNLIAKETKRQVLLKKQLQPWIEQEGDEL